jgi:hypothetical protein
MANLSIEGGEKLLAGWNVDGNPSSGTHEINRSREKTKLIFDMFEYVK